ncbi:MAG: glycosyltransferase family 2 protein [Lachnospira sp.]|nr:glycosyltransferase family 2 protein [Lachnospira sp.]
MSGKRLSIYIPTYNRCELLRPLLKQVLREMSTCVEDVELVISDNNSMDGTERMVYDTLSQFPDMSLNVRYHKNTENIGSCRNFLQVSDLVEGEFFVIIGDDDVLIPGGIKRIVDSLYEYGDKIDYACLNYEHFDIRDRNYMLENQTYTSYNSNRKNWFFDNDETILFSAWEDIYQIPCKMPSHIFTYLGCHLVRTELWKQYRDNIDIDRQSIKGHNSSEDYYLTMDWVFPHIKIVASALSKSEKGSLFIGTPTIGIGLGTQTNVSDNWPLIDAFVLDEVYEYYQSIDVDVSKLDKFVDEHEKLSGKCMAQIVANEDFEVERVSGYLRKHMDNEIFMNSYMDSLRDCTVSRKKLQYYNTIESVICGVVENLRLQNKKVAIWGAGEIAESIISNCPNVREIICRIVDGSSYKQGTELCGYTIYRPEMLKEDSPDVIIVASRKYAGEIVFQIKMMGLKGEIVKV